MLKYQVRFQCYGCTKDLYGRKVEGRLTDFSKDFKKIETAKKFLSQIKKFINIDQVKFSPSSVEEIRFLKKFVSDGYIKQCYGLFKVIEERIE